MLNWERGSFFLTWLFFHTCCWCFFPFFLNGSKCDSDSSYSVMRNERAHYSVWIWLCLTFTIVMESLRKEGLEDWKEKERPKPCFCISFKSCEHCQLGLNLVESKTLTAMRGRQTGLQESKGSFYTKCKRLFILFDLNGQLKWHPRLSNFKEKKKKLKKIHFVLLLLFTI